MGCCGNTGGSAAADARAEEDARQRNIQEAVGAINSQFSGFGSDFYNQRAKAYQDFAMPQLGEQYQTAARQTVGKLADQHLLDSSAARYLTNSLNRETAKQRQGIVDTSLQQAQQLKRDVEGERANLINQAQLAADPSLARQGALTAASTFQMPSAFAPVSNFLQGWASNYLQNQVAQTYNPGQSAGSFTPSFVNNPVVVRTQ